MEIHLFQTRSTQESAVDIAKDLSVESVKIFEMKSCLTGWLMAVTCSWPYVAAAQLRLVSAPEPQRVFSGAARQITTVWRNDEEHEFDATVRMHIYQTSSATAVPVDNLAWKCLHVLPHQTVIETAKLNFPEVKAEIKFVVHWVGNTNHVIGTTVVWVYPTNLLAELKPLLGQETLGVLDPNNELKPLLKQNGVAYVDLGQMALEDFSGRLAILGPFRSQSELPANLAKLCKVMAKHGSAILWILPPPAPRAPLQPSFYTVCSGTNVIVVVQADLLSELSEKPQSQQHLVQFCRLAMNPKPFTLPDSLNLTPENKGDQDHD